mmetsp:Transcript_17041/g.57218  ORF Transcript_17041/g.57218 Transcript_17041/m.57218 type:complete len:335 (-) Transcript_17041:194-1198(-)
MSIARESTGRASTTSLWRASRALTPSTKAASERRSGRSTPISTRTTSDQRVTTPSTYSPDGDDSRMASSKCAALASTEPPSSRTHGPKGSCSSPSRKLPGRSCRRLLIHSWKRASHSAMDVRFCGMGTPVGRPGGRKGISGIEGSSGNGKGSGMSGRSGRSVMFGRSGRSGSSGRSVMLGRVGTSGRLMTGRSGSSGRSVMLGRLGSSGRSVMLGTSGSSGRSGISIGGGSVGKSGRLPSPPPGPPSDGLQQATGLRRLSTPSKPVDQHGAGGGDGGTSELGPPSGVVPSGGPTGETDDDSFCGGGEDSAEGLGDGDGGAGPDQRNPNSRGRMT